jgi:hypothetical protein
MFFWFLNCVAVATENFSHERDEFERPFVINVVVHAV